MNIPTTWHFRNRRCTVIIFQPSIQTKLWHNEIHGRVYCTWEWSQRVSSARIISKLGEDGTVGLCWQADWFKTFECWRHFLATNCCIRCSCSIYEWFQKTGPARYKSCNASLIFAVIFQVVWECLFLLKSPLKFFASGTQTTGSTSGRAVTLHFRD